MFFLIKRIIDFSFAFIGIIFLLPFLLFITLILSIIIKENPFFCQFRAGKNQIPFKIIKFKTMNDDKDENQNLLPDEKRVTKIGVVLRKLSIDEMPQLINVIKGDMSIVGPRPLLTTYSHLYNDFQNRRHEVKPGITGWVQVNGRNAISWDKKFELDVWYVDNISLFLDFKIIMMTFKKVILRKGIDVQSDIALEPFDNIIKTN
jgi:undecaprenyl phosphate N,N'-diacetylbacillosamine 1-phosphate transferase